MSEVRHELKRHAARGLLAGMFGDAVLKAAGFVSTFLILAHVTPYQYGLWQLLLSISVAFAVVSLPGIAGMLVADISREYGAGNKARANGLLVRSSALFLSLGVLAAGTMFFAAPYMTHLTGVNLTALSQLMALALISYSFRQVFQLVFQSQLSLVHAQAAKALERVAYLAGITLFVVGMGKGVDGIAYAYVAASFAPVGVYLPVIIRRLQEALREYESESWSAFLATLWERGKWATLSDAGNGALGSLWPWITGAFLGVETLGFISIAILATSQVSTSIPVQQVLRAILPRTAQSAELLHTWMVRSMRYSVWALMLGGIGLVGLFALLSPLLFPQYTAALPYIAALLITLPLRGLGAVAGEYFYALGLQQSLFVVSTVPKLLMLALLPGALYLGHVGGFLLWYIVNADIILYARLRAIGAEGGRPITLSSLIMPEPTDVLFLDKVWETVRERARRFVARGSRSA